MLGMGNGEKERQGGEHGEDKAGRHKMDQLVLGWVVCKRWYSALVTARAEHGGNKREGESFAGGKLAAGKVTGHERLIATVLGIISERGG
jgi:hypothetical protein